MERATGQRRARRLTRLLFGWAFLCTSGVLLTVAFSHPPATNDVPAAFRVLPYLLSPSSTGVTIDWYSHEAETGTLYVALRGGTDSLVMTSAPVDVPVLHYSELEERERADFPDMFAGGNYKHALRVDGLTPGQTYDYRVVQGGDAFESHFRTAPSADAEETIRFVALADSETDPAGRSTYRKWQSGAQEAESTGRPDSLTRYLLTETEGFRRNLELIEARDPDFVMLAGDIVQGGGYQRAWDEFFFHTAGQFGRLLTHTPLVPAIGNWENYGARNGGYEPAAIAASRAKYAAYFDAPPNDNPDHRNFYYRIDYGPVTVLTLDSSNGLPDSTDQDTNIHIDVATYPGNDLPDINRGSDQWRWAEKQLREAHGAGQVIFVQFHHIPYSSGGHSLPLTAEGSSGQAGIPMRVYTPLFARYGVAAVFCGHNESFEHSVVDGIHFYDVGVAGDGLGYALDKIDVRFENPYRQWVAHHDAPELWRGRQLVDGGKHYGHLEVSVDPQGAGRFEIHMTPVYVFPRTNQQGEVVDVERRTYEDEVTFIHEPTPSREPVHDSQ